MKNSRRPQAAWRWATFLGGLALLAPAGGCATHTETGALVGAGAGTALGAGIGALTGHTGAGALIGAGAGTLVGAAAGAHADEHERRQEVRRQAIGLQDVVTLTQNGTSDAIIIEQIRTSGTPFHLSADQIVWLKQNGVHDNVIQEMQMTAYRPAPPPPVMVVHEQPPPVIYVEEPPPPPGVAVGVQIGGRR
jgi:Glycine zipper